MKGKDHLPFDCVPVTYQNTGDEIMNEQEMIRI